MELVLSEPEIKEPVVTVFDGNGRMYVAEMRTYMQDIDGTGEMNPVNRVSRHESTKGDGVYDKHTVFADGLLPPREVLPLADRVLINETNTSDIYAYFDTKGDGVSDKKELFYKGGPRGGNLEHQPSGLVWGLDNWIYQAVSDLRLRYTGGVVQEGHTPSNGGQWGLAQDDYGKTVGHQRRRRTWAAASIRRRSSTADSICPTTARRTFRKSGRWSDWPTCRAASAGSGPRTKRSITPPPPPGITVFRGDRLPADLEGDVFFDEPVGRLIRRAKVENKDGLTYLRNAYDKSEFLRSTDPYFRPVNITTGPDGCLYITDMYRGIIQEAAWVNEGSYLRKVVQEVRLPERHRPRPHLAAGLRRDEARARCRTCSTKRRRSS